MELGGHVGMGYASVESQAGVKGWGRWAVVVHRFLMMMPPFSVMCSDPTARLLRLTQWGRAQQVRVRAGDLGHEERTESHPGSASLVPDGTD